ncbi:hypothetical protein E1B28_008442 [Marasmius oreades]|uniref:Uncharacterized protein n=1 Tax=Marasmius oreades TaxID=181124 RepID=A0A9P7RZL3_9AGAR|nr:uncharacterized protein E1B28_008442 [Marasmius oreades]KAG7092061.1 hypothetical protein E1B28_008442 [Marasmius oreades]
MHRWFTLLTEGHPHVKKHKILKKWASWAAKGSREALEDGFHRRKLAPGEWVRICRGMYGEDYGLIWVSSQTMSYGGIGHLVLLVLQLKELTKDMQFIDKQIPASSKHKQREHPSPHLFNPHKCDPSTLRVKGFGDGVVHAWCFEAGDMVELSKEDGVFIVDSVNDAGCIVDCDDIVVPVLRNTIKDFNFCF